MYASDIKHSKSSLEEKLHRLYTLNRDKKIDLTFRPPYLKLLEKFGNPHLNLPPVVHVAGTNGKGSVIAIMRAILEEVGYKVHAYTSPHLREFNERIYLAGQNIDNEMLEVLVDEALELNADGDLTFFEITTAIAFAAFSRIPADILLLEVGLGGRLDCTNVIESPLATIITSISYDHMEHLGETLSEIAAEKAGIMKANSPCIIGVQEKAAIDDGVINVFESKAKELGSPLLCYDADWFINRQGNEICFSIADEKYLLPMPNLTGPHQIQNAGTALAALHAIQNDLPNVSGNTPLELLSPSLLGAGLCKINWPARLQKLDSVKFNLPESWEIWLDGGHNKSAGEALAKQAVQWAQSDPKKLHLVMGMMDHKDPAEFLESLLPHIASLSLIPIENEPHGYSPETLLNILHNASPGGKGNTNAEVSVNVDADIQIAAISENLQDAIKTVTNKHNSSGRILIAGSLYLAGHVLKY